MQSQIYFLCSEVFEDEWSGTLFYTVEGELGEDSFKIKAEELYLQDIGNKTYTEYDPGNPTFIKFLMENPRFMEMKQGHIHSHNTMSVFFSGTDMNEIRDNSEFHNYYLSLIVNNKNEMTAKVAFRATEKRETKSIVSFRGSDGTMRQKEITGETEESSVYSYNCLINKPDTVGESFTERFHGIQDEHERKGAERKKLAQQAKDISKNFEGRSTEDKAFGGFDGSKGYAQVGLFEDVKSESGRGKGKKAKEKQRGIVLPPDYKRRQVDSEDWLEENTRRIGAKDKDPNVYALTVKLLARDFLYEGKLFEVMNKIHTEFYSLSGVANGDEEAKLAFHDAISRTAISHYINMFPEDFQVVGFNYAIERVIDLIESYEGVYPELTLDLVETLTFAMD